MHAAVPLLFQQYRVSKRRERLPARLLPPLSSQAVWKSGLSTELLWDLSGGILLRELFRSLQRNAVINKNVHQIDYSIRLSPRGGQPRPPPLSADPGLKSGTFKPV